MLRATNRTSLTRLGRERMAWRTDGTIKSPATEADADLAHDGLDYGGCNDTLSGGATG